MFQDRTAISIFSIVSGRQPTPDNDDGLQTTTSSCLYDRALREDGLLHGTMVAAEDGWRPVESIQPGEHVMTFDHGLSEVVENRTIALSFETIPSHKAFLMHIPSGALGNRRDMTLLPMQEVILESDQAEAIYGDPFVLIPSLMLAGFKGISKTPMSGDIIVSMLLFDDEQLVQTESGLLTLAHAHRCLSPLTMATPYGFDQYTRLPHTKLRELIDLEQASERPGPAFAGQSIDDVHAALEARAL